MKKTQTIPIAWEKSPDAWAHYQKYCAAYKAFQQNGSITSFFATFRWLVWTKNASAPDTLMREHYNNVSQLMVQSAESYEQQGHLHLAFEARSYAEQLAPDKYPGNQAKWEELRRTLTVNPNSLYTDIVPTVPMPNITTTVYFSWEQKKEHSGKMSDVIFEIILDKLKQPKSRNSHKGEYREYEIENLDQYGDLCGYVQGTLVMACDRKFLYYSFQIEQQFPNNKTFTDCYKEMADNLLKECFQYKRTFRKDTVRVNFDKYKKSLVSDIADKYSTAFKKLSDEACKKNNTLPKFAPAKLTPPIRQQTKAPTPSAPQLIKQNPNAPARMFSTSPKPLQKPPTPPDLNSSAIYVK